MLKIINNDENDIRPKGFRYLTDDEIAEHFRAMDVDKSYTITKNEWMAFCLKIVFEDIAALDEKGPDYIMQLIKEFSNEFDVYDENGDKSLDFFEFKDFVCNNIMITE